MTGKYPTAKFAYTQIQDTLDNLALPGLTLENRIGINIDHWKLDSLFFRDYISTTTALSTFFILTSSLIARPWARRNTKKIANALGFTGLTVLAFYKSYRDLFLAVFVMAAFGVFQRRLSRKAPSATTAARASSAVQNRAVQTDSEMEGSTTLRAPTVGDAGKSESVSSLQLGQIGTKLTATDHKDKEIVRLQTTITELKTTLRAGEVQLRIVKEELESARSALNATYSEYSKLRKEIQIAKQKVGSDYQNTLYRKDIEMFALRKANEQKDNQIQEFIAKVQEIQRQQRIITESKDAQLRVLANRLTFKDQQSKPESESLDTSDQAVEVRLLKVTNNRNSSELKRENKDATIAKLKEQLAMANRASQVVVNQQAELQRAWDFANDVQNALRGERQRHSQTSEQLQELTVKMAEQENQRSSQISLDSRLPTINEDGHDQTELEAMFDAAQKENLRLHAEVEQLGKQLRDVTNKLFSVEQDNHALRDQVRFGNGMGDDVQIDPIIGEHRARFYRLESQLKETEEAVVNKTATIEQLEKKIAQKDDYIKDLKEEVDAAIQFHTQDQDEIESLRQIVAKLEAAKEQLLLDHERLASHRSRQSDLTTDGANQRLSGATFTVDASSQCGSDSNETNQVEVPPPMPVLVEATSREDARPTSKQHVKSGSTSNRQTVILADAERSDGVVEEKATRRMSMRLKGMMRKIGKKNTAALDEQATIKRTASEKKGEKGSARVKSLVIPKNNDDIAILPETTSPTHVAIQMVTEQSVQSPFSPSVSQSIRPQSARPRTTRYYSTQDVDEKKPRPKSYAASETTRPALTRTWSSA